ncbi:MAG: hypothetical protein PHC66_05105 [Candidatus Nanoarchaeia archaeon]|nr:hypothetical protein [Candidatus Nanoarchaeia archaeon]MDD5239064.1 hypothetical protein [Candidatus Nanoarchaeia archaeon]
MGKLSGIQKILAESSDKELKTSLAKGRIKIPGVELSVDFDAMLAIKDIKSFLKKPPEEYLIYISCPSCPNHDIDSFTLSYNSTSDTLEYFSEADKDCIDLGENGCKNYKSCKMVKLYNELKKQESSEN